jgi:hypothetical protein
MRAKVMKVIKRLRVQREFFDARRSYIKGGMKPAEAGEQALAVMQEKYGRDLDWAAILELLMMILVTLFVFEESPQPQ